MASSLSCGCLAAWTLAAVLLQTLGLALFVIGFFPVKPSLPGFSGPESYRMPTCDSSGVGGGDDRQLPADPDHLRSLYREMSNISSAFDRLVLMVIDGLPSEFVLGRGDKPPTESMIEAMPYTQLLLSNGLATAYHAKAAPPTVTMPRLKAIVSGAIGGFLDVAFNFNSQAFLDDNLLDQFYHIGRKLVMLGDETWIKLFPGLFTRQDGVSSFYVKDTVEVDYNVSRHLEAELAANDWSLLILHYLGLDHVGHLGGRHSFLMAPKLKEMDQIIEMVHKHLILHQNTSDRRTLLLVVSDHGMTNGGNHGGSSYEETDTLALFIGLGSEVPDPSPNSYDAVFQVDVAPTLALLFGVPIPKNNVGVLLKETFNSFPDEQKLRALQLNSWQLLRLLQAHLHCLVCRESLCAANDELDLHVNGSIGTTEEKLCHLYLKAMLAHQSWELHRSSGFISNNSDDFRVAVGSYYNFLRNASEWLSHRATDKPASLLVSGIALILVSCILLLHLLFCLFKEVNFTQKPYILWLQVFGHRWQLDEAFVFLGVLIHVLSLGASSLVEEEQYTWHFLTSTLYLIFLFKTIQSFLSERESTLIKGMDGNENHILHQSWRTNGRGNTEITSTESLQWKYMHYYQIYSVFIVLICGRMLRGWHQGGVNWIHLPDMAKWLKQAGDFSIRISQMISLILLMILGSFALRLVRSRKSLVFAILFIYFAAGLLVLLHIMEYESHSALPVDHSSTLIAQIFYVTVGVTVILTVLATPWILPVVYQGTHWITKFYFNSMNQVDSRLLAIQDSTYLIGLTYTVSWCLLQLLLQQPVNAVPIFLLLLQLLASMVYFLHDWSHHRQWVKVAAHYFLGMAGHFGLGNSNSLATIDVAGAFIGISNHSTVLSGILMFIITYASPLLCLLSMVMCISLKDMDSLCDQKSELGSVLQMMIAFPCLIPLVFNSIVLTVFTVILLVMRNHLFVWSVFSPKYLYSCAATVSIYTGVFLAAATASYICIVFFYRTKMLRPRLGSSGVNCNANKMAHLFH